MDEVRWTPQSTSDMKAKNVGAAMTPSLGLVTGSPVIWNLAASSFWRKGVTGLVRSGSREPCCSVPASEVASQKAKEKAPSPAKRKFGFYGTDDGVADHPFSVPASVAARLRPLSIVPGGFARKKRYILRQRPAHANPIPLPSNFLTMTSKAE